MMKVDCLESESEKEREGEREREVSERMERWCEGWTEETYMERGKEERGGVCLTYFSSAKYRANR
jgi:hypothetical protein